MLAATDYNVQAMRGDAKRGNQDHMIVSLQQQALTDLACPIQSLTNSPITV